MLMTNQQSAELTEPGIGSLHDPAAFVASHFASVFIPPPLIVLSVGRDQFDGTLLQSFTQRIGVVAGVGDRVTVVAARAETLAADPAHRGRWGAVVARAVADLTELAELALPLLRPDGLLVAWKRRPFDEELTRAEQALHQLGGRVAEVASVAVPGLEDHVLAVVEKVAETPQEFPRDPAVRRRRPL